MDRDAVRADFDEQIRRHPETGPGILVQRDAHTTRVVGPVGGWSGVTWSELTEADVDLAIRNEVEVFTTAGRTWEWKYYSYDQPATLPRRLRDNGLVPAEPEAFMVAPLSELDRSVVPPPGVEVVHVVDDQGVDDLVRVHDDVFGGDHSSVGRSVRAELASRRGEVEAYVAYHGVTPIAAGRVTFHIGTDFASLWGGGTLPAWRGRGVFRALVLHRAARARARGFRYLQVDASPDSRPILHGMGFVELATTIPFTMGT